MARKSERLDDVKMIWPNFEGRPGMYNAEGNRNFVLELDDRTAEKLLKDGWNVKTKPPRNEGDEPSHTLSVAVSFKFKAPRIVMITSGQRTPLDEGLCGLVDHADVEKVDVILEQSRWEMNGNTGIKAYLKTIYVTIHEDPLDLKYAHIPLAGGTAQLELESSTNETLALEAGWSDNPDILDAEVISEEYDE